jgi:hypothetical protein
MKMGAAPEHSWAVPLVAEVGGSGQEPLCCLGAAVRAMKRGWRLRPPVSLRQASAWW